MAAADPSPAAAPSATDGPPVGVFYSYAHEDEPLRDELAGHLKILERRGLIRVWHDRRIVAGADWSQAIDSELDRADLILLLVSKDFIESDYIFGVELRRAMARQSARACDVVPIIVRAVDIAPEDAEDPPFQFMKLQALPTDLRAVTSWPNRDEAWTNVAKGLRVTVKSIRERRSAQAPPQAPAALPPAALPPNVASPAARADVLGPQPAGAAPEFEVRFATADLADEPRDAVLEQVVGGVVAQVDEAQRRKTGHAVYDHVRYELELDARSLIDRREPTRVLWVDDHPENNRAEAAALAKLQIEVVSVTSTAEALARVAHDAALGEPFDLVLSDAARTVDGPLAVIGLLQALRGAGVGAPLVCYHAVSDPARRAALAQALAAAGAFAEAVTPTELMAAIGGALRPAA